VTGSEEQAGENKTTGFRTYGKTKDSRDDLPQIVIGMAVTRDGIPVRVWCWPGNTGDSALIRQVKADMRDWSLGRVVRVTDRGFSSKENRRYLQGGAGNYIIAEKLRSDSPDIKTALSRQGRYHAVAGNLQVKEVQVADANDRFVICYNPDAATRDANTRAELITKLEDLIAGSDKLTAAKCAECSTPGLVETGFSPDALVWVAVVFHGTAAWRNPGLIIFRFCFIEHLSSCAVQLPA
jgi:transposase